MDDKRYRAEGAAPQVLVPEDAIDLGKNLVRFPGSVYLLFWAVLLLSIYTDCIRIHQLRDLDGHLASLS